MTENDKCYFLAELAMVAEAICPTKQLVLLLIYVQNIRHLSSYFTRSSKL